MGRVVKRLTVCMIMAMILLLAGSTVFADGKMNAAVICLTDDGSSSASSMAKVIADNKLSIWKLNKVVSYYKDCDKRPATKASVNTILDSAFGSSTESDINYLYIASHGYSGTSEPNRVVYANTGLVLDMSKGENAGFEGLYKYTDLIGRLIGYKGQFVIILDACYSENLIYSGLGAHLESAGRFTIICSSARNEVAWGAAKTEFVTSRMVSGLTYSGYSLAADTNLDGFVSLQELFDYTKWGQLSSIHAYGSSKSLLFQRAYVKFKESSHKYDYDKTKSVSLLSEAVPHNAAPAQSIRWKSSNTSVAAVNDKGFVSANKPGTTVITAYYADQNGKMCYGSESTCTLVFEEKELKIDPASVTLYKGQSKKIRITEGKTSAKVTWSSSDKSVASVSGGTVKAKKPGSAVITVKNGTKTAKCSVKVLKPTISLNPVSAEIQPKSSLKILATVKGPSSKVKWSSSKSSVASVSNGTVKAKKEGTCVIKAKANGVTATCKITVKKKKDLSWQAAYRPIIRSNKSTVVQLMDLNGDDTPELLIGSYPGSGSFSILGHAYTCSDGKAKKLTVQDYMKASNTKYEVYKKGSSRRVEGTYTVRAGFGYYDTVRAVYQFKGSKVSYINRYVIGNSGNTKTYYVNGKKVSKSSYDSSLKSFHKGWKKQSGTEYAGITSYKSHSDGSINTLYKNYCGVVVG